MSIDRPCDLDHYRFISLSRTHPTIDPTMKRTREEQTDGASSSSSSSSAAASISEDEAALYDRQIRLWGLEAQGRMRSSRVLLAGLRGLMCEVAKNIVLAGVGVVMLLDPEPPVARDAAAHFALDLSATSVRMSERASEYLIAISRAARPARRSYLTHTQSSIASDWKCRQDPRAQSTRPSLGREWCLEREDRLVLCIVRCRVRVWSTSAYAGTSTRSTCSIDASIFVGYTMFYTIDMAQSINVGE